VEVTTGNNVAQAVQDATNNDFRLRTLAEFGGRKFFWPSPKLRNLGEWRGTHYTLELNGNLLAKCMV